MSICALQVVLAALVIADCTSFMPRNPNEKDDPILQVSTDPVLAERTAFIQQMAATYSMILPMLCLLPL